MNQILAKCFLPFACAVALSGAMLAASSRPAAAQGDAEAGRHLAQTWCSGCHVVGPSDHATSNGAPTFAAVAHTEGLSAESLAAFLRAPHGRMPDLHLSRPEIGDLSAYIRSLR
jgi:mono/diheme cytochrome c family protein